MVSRILDVMRSFGRLLKPASFWVALTAFNLCRTNRYPGDSVGLGTKYSVTR